ncbi:hypothetical protein [Bosea sp. CS1GBMeth4]|nr:hypothetical protein [Bosea sp. CS1GBMeth4]
MTFPAVGAGLADGAIGAFAGLLVFAAGFGSIALKRIITVLSVGSLAA